MPSFISPGGLNKTVVFIEPQRLLSNAYQLCDNAYWIKLPVRPLVISAAFHHSPQKNNYSVSIDLQCPDHTESFDHFFPALFENPSKSGPGHLHLSGCLFVIKSVIISKPDRFKFILFFLQSFITSTVQPAPHRHAP